MKKTAKNSYQTLKAQVAKPNAKPKCEPRAARIEGKGDLRAKAAK